MRFAFTTILMAPRFGWQPPPDRPVRRALYDQVRDMGFDGVEWSPRWFDYDGLATSEVDTLKQEVLDYGLAVSALNLNRFMLTRCPEASRHQERLIRSIEVAHGLGAGSVIVSLSLPQPPSARRPRLIGQTIPPEEFNQTAELLRGVARRANGYGVELVLELHDDGMLDTPELCLRMVRAVDCVNVRVNPDLGNLIRHPESCDPWRAALEKLAPCAGYWHVKNYRNGQPAPIWNGDIDYAEAFAMVQARGYNGWVSVESYFGDDVMSLQRQSLEWLRELESRAATV